MIVGGPLLLVPSFGVGKVQARIAQAQRATESRWGAQVRGSGLQGD
ncbi:hypothetical protein H4W33_002007 [Kibdelosporangium phytohabitans]|nr:hypothetical protein [Kibdelosporangium phytohabitans]